MVFLISTLVSLNRTLVSLTSTRVSLTGTLDSLNNILVSFGVLAVGRRWPSGYDSRWVSRRLRFESSFHNSFNIKRKV